MTKENDMIQKFQKKPVTIEAMQYIGKYAIVEIISWVISNDGDAQYRCDNIEKCSGADENHSLVITTLEGDMTVSEGDWVIKGIKGEFYPCKPDIFQESYSAVL